MPNILAHMVIGAEVMGTTDPVALLGTAMPDFIGMYQNIHGGNLRRNDFIAVPGLYAGIALHQPTDDVFDALPRTKELVRWASADFAAIAPALGSGAIRGCARLAPDILLDGVLLQDPEVEKFYEQTREALVSGPIFSRHVPHAAELESLIQEYFSRGVSYRYQNTEDVADIMKYRLDHRPTKRLQFNESAIPAVAESLDIQLLRLQQVSKYLILHTVQGLADGYLDERAAA